MFWWNVLIIYVEIQTFAVPHAHGAKTCLSKLFFYVSHMCVNCKQVQLYTVDLQYC